MKKSPAHILIFFLLLYSCEVENSVGYDRIESIKPEVATESPSKHQLDQSSKTTIFTENAQQAVVVDSTLWMDAMHSISKPEKEMLYINTRWEIIDKESFLDSVTMSNYGSIVLSSNTMRKARKLKKIINS